MQARLSRLLETLRQQAASERDRYSERERLFSAVVESSNDAIITKALDVALKRRPALKTLFTSGYTENAIVHHGRLDAGVLLLAKPYRKSDLAKMIRMALDS
ncbi:hypothetical protein [Bradyrhizobium sp.]|uniref:hypothetical protein n=1 Tax=Bradyrhizobium sp. TaxID=376 RepID=UPI003C774BDC